MLVGAYDQYEGVRNCCCPQQGWSSQGRGAELIQAVNDFKRLSSCPPSLFILDTPGSSKRVII